MPRTFDANDILRITDDLQDQIDDLNCELDSCCSKHPENCGDGAQIYKGYSNGHWNFRTLVAGDNITIEEDNCEIVISATGGSGSFTCSDLNSCSTTNLPEGSNLYFTDERAQDAVGNILTNSSQITFTYNDGTPSISAGFTSNNISQFTNNAGYITCSDVNSCITGTANQVLYYNSSGNLSSDSNFTRIPSGIFAQQTIKIVDGLNKSSSITMLPTSLEIYNDFSGVDDGGKLILDNSAKLGRVLAGNLDSYIEVLSLGFSYNHVGTGLTLNYPTADGSSGDVLTTDGAGNLTFQPASGGGLITAIADTNTIDLTETAGTLTADVNYQNSTDINLSEDASGLKAEFASHNVSQFTNDSGYFVNGGALSNGTTATTQTLTDTSTKVATDEFVAKFFNPETFKRVYSDLTGLGTAISANTDVGTEWRISLGNTGTLARDTAAYSNAVGVVSLLTNLNAGGRACFSSFGWYLGSRTTCHAVKLKIPVLATTAQNFYSGIGFIDTTQFSAVTNGVMVYCVDGSNSGNWIIKTMNGGVATTFNTSITPVADTFTVIKIVVNAAGTEVRVYFDGVEPSGIGYPITTNIPAASASQLLGSVCIEKTNGTTSRTIAVDYIDTQQY